jgi:DNA-binding transcriptional MerR regulator
MSKPTSIALTTNDVIAAVRALEQEPIPERTLARWAASALASPSIRAGAPAPGGGRLYSLTDLARIRLIVQLRRRGLSANRIRILLAYLDATGELRDVLRDLTDRRGRKSAGAELVVDGFTALIVRDGQRREIPSGQLRLPLREVVDGNAATAARLKRSA